MDKRLTATQAAEYLGMTYRQFWRLKELIPYHRIKKGWRYYWQSDCDKWKDNARKPKTPPAPIKKKKQLINLADCPKRFLER